MALWFLQLIADALLGTYVFLLLQFKKRAHERRTKVSYIERPRRTCASGDGSGPQRTSPTRRRCSSCAAPPLTRRIPDAWTGPGRSQPPATSARAALEAKHAPARSTLTASRQAIRTCAIAIRAVQRHEFDAARDPHRRGGRAARRGRPRPRRRTSTSATRASSTDAQKEFAEAEPDPRVHRR